ncbi:hypothetical protein ACHOLT_19085 [Desulfitobacterium sp. Sab5]|uniref:hypothetical protein n=1 Tax=Desulfitobacterium nosdiversum TaxID=3375356 RepID=UPI003CEF50D9
MSKEKSDSREISFLIGGLLVHELAVIIALLLLILIDSDGPCCEGSCCHGACEVNNSDEIEPEDEE